MISAGLDQHRHSLHQVGRPARATADLPQDLPGLELRIGPFAGTALAGMGGVDFLLRARQPPVAAGVRVQAASALRNPDRWPGRISWYPYLTRRMAEPPANLLFFLRALANRY